VGATVLGSWICVRNGTLVQKKRRRRWPEKSALFNKYLKQKFGKSVNIATGVIHAIGGLTVFDSI
jgi:hypothetical protein